ncbi:MAG: hypothetical protein NVSMB64_27170 [Candidatus Velthaea sp.]
MRLCLALCAAIVATVVTTAAALAAPPRSLDLTADSVRYFSNRFVVTGDGNVRLRLSDGTIVRGETFAMDLKLNRYIVAGNVRLESDAAIQTGAAFSGFNDLDKSYFLASDETPDRWTFSGQDFKAPSKGRQQPGDAFAIPDLTDERPYIYAKSASIVPKTNVKFVGSRIYVLGAYVPTPSYVVSFSANPNFSQNAFAGATADVGLPYTASRNAVSSFHLRYDTIRKAYLSFDQHFARDRDYVVFSVNPLTQEQRQFNLIGYKRVSPKFDARTFLQLSTAQHGIYQPEAAGAYSNVQLNRALRRSALALTYDQYNTSLLGHSTFEQQNEHPSDALLSWTGFDNKLGKTPVTFRLRSGIGFAHDGFHAGLNVPDGLYLQNFAGTKVTTLWQKFAGIDLYTPSVRIARSTYLNATFDKQRTWYSLPHHIDRTATRVSLSKLYGTKASVLLAYSIANNGDYYGGRQAEFYPANGPIGTSFGTFGSYDSFRGFSTNRALTGSIVLTPNPNFNLNLTVTRNYDYPAPIPGAFGLAPVQLSGEFRLRLARQILMDVSRSYFFNFANQRWSPQFQVQFGP